MGDYTNNMDEMDQGTVSEDIDIKEPTDGAGRQYIMPGDILVGNSVGAIMLSTRQITFNDVSEATLWFNGLEVFKDDSGKFFVEIIK